MNKAKEIRSLHETIAKERVRLIGVCGLTEPLQVFSMLIEEAVNHQATSLNHGLGLLNATKNCVHDYSRVYDLQVREIMKQHRKKIRSQSYSRTHCHHSETKEERRISQKVMLDWINVISRDVSTRVVPLSGRTASKFLPPFDRTVDFPALHDGKQLCRVVLSLVIDTCETASENDEDTRIPPTIEQLEDMKAVADRPELLVKQTLSLALYYLHIPIYRVDDILQGNHDVIKNLVSNLILLSPPNLHHEDTKLLLSDISQYQTLGAELVKVNHELTAQPLLGRLHTAWSSMGGNASKDSSGPELMSRRLSQEIVLKAPTNEGSKAYDSNELAPPHKRNGSAAPATQADAFDTYLASSTAVSDAFNGSEEKSNGSRPTTQMTSALHNPGQAPRPSIKKVSFANDSNVEAAAAAAVARAQEADPEPVRTTPAPNRPPRAIGTNPDVNLPMIPQRKASTVEVNGKLFDPEIVNIYPMVTLGQRYEILSNTVDEFLKHGADKRLIHSIAKFGRTMRAIGKLRDDFDSLLKNNAEGVKLAAEVRQQIMAHNSVRLLRFSGWLADEEELDTPTF